MLENLPEWTDLLAVLTWVAIGGGAPFVINYAFALLAENWSGWHKLPRWVKFLVPLILSASLAIGAQALITFEPELIEQVAPFWRILIIAIIAWLGSQRGYIMAKSAGYGATR